MAKRSKIKYVATFSLATLIFVTGVMVGQTFIEWKSREFSTFAEELKLSILTMDTQEKIASEYLCQIDPFELTKQKVELGRILTFLEQKLGKLNEKVLEGKKEYSLLSIRQWLLVRKFNEECNGNLTMILFFYSNIRNASLSESQGYVLDYLYQKYPKRIVTYALDVDLGGPAIDTLKKLFGIKQIPSLVINGKLYSGFREKDEIERLLLL